MIRALVFLFAFPFSISDSEDGLLAWWKFDDTSLDCIADIEDVIEDNYRFVEGVSGKALRFDGFTTAVVREKEKAPELGDELAIEAWIALGAYPWNVCPLVTRRDDRGCSFPSVPAGR